MTDEDIDYSDIPELDEDFWRRAALWQGNKVQITLRLDPNIVAFFKQQGKGYQTNINAVLREYVKLQMQPMARKAAPAKASGRKAARPKRRAG